MKKIIPSLLLAFAPFSFLCAAEVSFEISKQYLNFPISHKNDRREMTFSADGIEPRKFVIRVAEGDPEYWVFLDVSEFRGKKITLASDFSAEVMGKIYQDDAIAGGANLYREPNRPQLHFSPRRGWMNDPNGLIFYEGEWHLFFQHNPYERDWENMHWGHAVSKDLLHWSELPLALFPDKNGTAYSGSAVMDYNNTSGFGTKQNPAMVAFYTGASPDRQVQCVAYSTDKGRTWKKYSGNPVINSKEKWDSQDTRDPNVFWYEPNKEWVLVVNERDGHSIYTSPDTKKWHFQSHTTGFWECPELFPLAIDGDPKKTKWVMYGASGTYMIGGFDGKKFTPENGKFVFTRGAIYAAQTFENVPKNDGRRIQIGWGRIGLGGGAFNQVMLLPTELTLRTTKNGPRLFSNPVREIDALQGEKFEWKNLTAGEANEKLHALSDTDCLRIKTTIKFSHATNGGFNLYAQRILDYDLNGTSLNGNFFSPQDMTSMELSADIILDKGVIEVFVDGGAFSFSMERRPDRNNREGFHFWGNRIEVKTLEVWKMKSIWEK